MYEDTDWNVVDRPQCMAFDGLTRSLMGLVHWRCISQYHCRCKPLLNILREYTLKILTLIISRLKLSVIVNRNFSVVCFV